MKNILIICFALFLAGEVSGQSAKLKATIPSTVFGDPSGTDSTVNYSTAVTYLYVKPSLGYKCGSIQYVATRHSASMGGTVVVQGSNDGINYVTPENFATDTLTISNAATSTGAVNIIPDMGLIYQYYRLKCTGASNDTATVKAYFHGRP